MRDTHKTYEFLKDYRAAALATVNKNGNPHVATVYCVADKDLNVYFVTGATGRKYANLIEHPCVAMSIADEARLITVQLSGLATPIENDKLEAHILRSVWRLRSRDTAWPVPLIKLFEKGAANELCVIKIAPKELTYARFDTSYTGIEKSYFQKVI